MDTYLPYTHEKKVVPYLGECTIMRQHNYLSTSCHPTNIISVERGYSSLTEVLPTLLIILDKVESALNNLISNLEAGSTSAQSTPRHIRNLSNSNDERHPMITGNRPNSVDYGPRNATTIPCSQPFETEVRGPIGSIGKVSTQFCHPVSHKF